MAVHPVKSVGSFLVLFMVFMAATALPNLDVGEVQALKRIGKQLGKKDWDFGKDPCSGSGSWIAVVQTPDVESNVTCGDCSNTSCHIVSLVLKGQNLSGTLPPDFYRLQHLKTLDLSRNLLKGSVPSQWGTMQLEELSFMGNLLSGPFPLVLTNITTLRNLSIEGNSFWGPIPNEIGNLIKLKKLVLSSNAFTGELPMALAKLTSLIDLRISDNNFAGKIPTIFDALIEIETLHIQGCSLEGPIPHRINALTNLTDLRISDLKGGFSRFPRLTSMNSLKILILRKCLLSGKIPDHIGSLTMLKTIDLSFNYLHGSIPESFKNLSTVDFMYLNGNYLNGSLPPWIQIRNKNRDFSFNNFTWVAQNSSSDDCPQGLLNLVKGYSSTADNSLQPCLKKNFPCVAPSSQYRYFLHINCGGKETIANGKTYDADLEETGASRFRLHSSWALSSSGIFMDNDGDADLYIEGNTSALSDVSAHESELYMTARLSPSSLTYYGLCLMEGSYTIRLHFAEIIFRNDGSFMSLGRRIFDVYIQGGLVLKEFNIEREAGGPGKPIVKTFVENLTSNTLEIRLDWAGKGTTGIPFRGVYGPLISAITIEPNFEPPQRKKYYDPIVIGIVAAIIILVLIGFGALRMTCTHGDGTFANSALVELEQLKLQVGPFSLDQIKVATENFSASNKIGEGGFGPVYKGVLPNGVKIAVKKLSARSKQGNKEFVNEVGLISALQHPHLVKLYGCCVEGNQSLLVYEFMENNSLSRALFGRIETRKLRLDWPTRQNICLGIAKGLAYLHENPRFKTVHRDIKPGNILLDKNMIAKISDFGMARLVGDANALVSTGPVGTFGYLDLEYARHGHLTDKVDVYSFGIVALEILTGQRSTSYPKDGYDDLLERVDDLSMEGDISMLVDPELHSEYSVEEALRMLKVGIMCTIKASKNRPMMAQVVCFMEGQSAFLVAPPKAGSSTRLLEAAPLTNREWWETPSASPTITGDVSECRASASTSMMMLRTGTFCYTVAKGGLGELQR